jgi:hypothetical protein
MSLTKIKKVDKIETFAVKDHYLLNIREKTQIIEKDENNNDIEIGSSFHRYGLAPDADVSTITDDLVKAQFEAVMTDEVKANYAKFLKEQAEQNKAS